MWKIVANTLQHTSPCFDGCVLVYVCSERKDTRAPMLRRTFLRGLVRQMGSPAVLAATYSNNTEQMASAAVNELQEALVRHTGYPGFQNCTIL